MKTKLFFLPATFLGLIIFLFVGCKTTKSTGSISSKKEVVQTQPINFQVFRIQRYSSVSTAKEFSDFFSQMDFYNGIEIRLDTTIVLTFLKKGSSGENIREVHKRTLVRIIPPFTELKDQKILEFDNLGYPKSIVGSFDLSDESFKDFKFRRTVDGAMVLSSGTGVIVDDSTGQKYNVPVKIVSEKYCPLVEKTKDNISIQTDTKIAGEGSNQTPIENTSGVKWE